MMKRNENNDNGKKLKHFFLQTQKYRCFIFGMLFALFSGTTFAAEKKAPIVELPGHLGLHAGVSYDLLGAGFAWGLGASFLFPRITSDKVSTDLQELVLDASFFNRSWSGRDGQLDTEESQALRSFSARFNLINGYQRNGHFFFVFGFGFTIMNIDYERQIRPTGVSTPFATDITLDKNTFGNFVNLGIGHTIGRHIEARLEIPIMIVYSTTAPQNFLLPLVLTTTYRF